MLRATWHRAIPARNMRSRLHPTLQRRAYSETPAAKSAHAQWYADVVPAMIPVALLGSAVYLGLSLAQGHLSHEKYLEEARTRVQELEAEVAELRASRPAPAPTPAPDNKSSRSWLGW